MKENRFDVNRRMHQHAQGSLVQHENSPGGMQPNLTRMVVLDVVSDPAVIDDTKIAYWEHTLKVRNIRFAKVLPRNTIIGQRVLDGSAPATDLPMFLFSFFPSHLALPCKPGEHVWVMFEHPDARFSEMGYWMCRITEPHIVDDVNHTHAARQFDPSFTQSTRDSFDGNKAPTYEFRNGVVDVADGQRYVVGGTPFLEGPEDVYENLMIDTDAAKAEQHEAVPRFRKRPGDIVLEGSNNTRIVLGTDRSGDLTKYQTDPDRGKVPAPTDDLTGHAGSIDIVTGVGQTADTGGTRVTSKRLSGASFKEELGKGPNEVVAGEGNPDFKNDRTRLLLAQKTLADANFALDSFNAKFEIEDSAAGDGAIVLKTDKIRLIARSDIQLVVPGVPTRDGQGNLVENDDKSTWVSITLKSDGSIILEPATRGVLKLGGPDANKAILCQPAITGVDDGTGQVSASPIIDSMFGSQGGDPPGPAGVNGQFATKVLIK